MGRAFDRRVAREPRVGPGVEIAADVAGDDPPVPHQPVLDIDALAPRGLP